jgi:plastocyanin
MIRRLTTASVVVVMAIALAACSGASGSAAPTAAVSPAGPAPASAAGGGAPAVDIKNFAFAPASASVAAGSKVTWTNSDTTAHTVTFDDGSADSGNLAAGATFDHTFATAGTFAYHCAIHSSMKGTVTVQ